VVLSGYSGFLYHYNWFHDIAEILLKVVLSTINQIKSIKIDMQEERGRVHCPKYYLGFGYGVHQYFNYIVVVCFTG
jgi:hypothetical protein